MLHVTCCTLRTPPPSGWGAMLHCVNPCCIGNFRCVDLSRCVNFLFVVPFGTMLPRRPPSLGWGSMLHCVDHVACYMLHSKDPPSIGVGSHVALCESVLHRKFPLCGLVSMCELFVRGTIWYHVA